MVSYNSDEKHVFALFYIVNLYGYSLFKIILSVTKTNSENCNTDGKSQFVVAARANDSAAQFFWLLTCQLLGKQNVRIFAV